MNIKYMWSGLLLWGTNEMAGLGLVENGYWCSLSTSGNSAAFPKDTVIETDKTWAMAFEKIENGLKPDWCACSCGAAAVMGSDWEMHDGKCNSIVLPSPFAPSNNDNRAACYMCFHPTRYAGGGQYRVCNNKKCDWFNK